MPAVARPLQLRPFHDDDAAVFVDAVRESIPQLRPWMDWCHEEYQLDEALQWFAQCRQAQREDLAYDLGIFDADGELLGSVGLNQLNRVHNFANLGYWVRSSRHGQGMATRAASMMLDFGFRSLQLSRIEIVVPEANLASLRVAQKLGAELECRARNRLMLHSQPVAAWVLSVIPDEAREGHASSRDSAGIVARESSVPESEPIPD